MTGCGWGESGTRFSSLPAWASSDWAAQPPLPEWGAMIAQGRAFLSNSCWYPTFPGLAIMLTVLGFNLIGDGLRDALDPRSGRARRM